MSCHNRVSGDDSPQCASPAPRPVRARARARARALNRRPDPDWGRARLCGVRRGTLGPTLRAPDNNYDYCPNNQDLFQWAQSGSAQTNLFHTTSANYQLSSGLRWVETSLPDHLGQAGKPGPLLSDLIALGFPTYRSLCWVPGPSNPPPREPLATKKAVGRR